MSQIVSEFISDLAVHFGRKHDNVEAEQAWLKSMFACLRGFDHPTLKTAAEEIINSRSERSFPLPAECRDTCHRIAAKTATNKRAAELPWEKPSPFSEERIRLADDLVQNAHISKEAAREGWILALHDHCRDHGMLPVGREIDKCKQAAKNFDKSYETCVRGEGGLCNASLLALGTSMIARREDLRARILGERPV